MVVRELPTIYQLKVTLENTSPPIWRRILVPSNINLGEFHIVLQIAMGWTNSHLHQFITTPFTSKRSRGVGREISPPTPLRPKPISFCSPDICRLQNHLLKDP